MRLPAWWEYKSVMVDAYWQGEQALNAYGRDGWEVIAASLRESIGGSSHWTCLLKRRRWGSRPRPPGG